MSEAGHRYAVITADNQSANIWVCAIVGIALGTACLIGRGLFRYRLGFAFSNDDWVFFSSWIVQVIAVGVLLKATAMGLGQDHSLIDDNVESSVRDHAAAATVLTVVAIYLAKTSMVMLIGRLFARSVRIYWVIVAIFGLVSAIQMEAGCVYPTCTNVGPRYIVYSTFDIVTEIIIISLPVYYIQEVRMNPRRKAKVLLTFSSRALIIIFAGLIIWAANRVREIGQFTTSITLPTILLQLELGTSIIICAVIPCFRMIFQSSDVILSSGEPSQKTQHQHDSHQQHSQQLRSFGEVITAVTAQTDTQISYVRMPTPPPPEIPQKPEHTPQSSRDITTATTEGTARPSEGRASESSVANSGTTGLSSKALFQAPIP